MHRGRAAGGHTEAEEGEPAHRADVARRTGGRRAPRRMLGV
jgi:hypothetical protein